MVGDNSSDFIAKREEEADPMDEGCSLTAPCGILRSRTWFVLDDDGLSALGAAAVAEVLGGISCRFALLPLRKHFPLC